jgi:hypothetical protein
MNTKMLRNQILLLLVLCFSCTITSAQAPPVKQWDKTFGGSDDDQLKTLQQTADGGYILGGYSNSGSSGDKTDPNRGDDDYWVVKIDANGKKQWDKTFGNNAIWSSNYEELTSLQQTIDGGYILGGSSTSFAYNGNGLYWVIKLDSKGNEQWEKSYGTMWSEGEPVRDNRLQYVQQTKDGGYILGGWSECNGTCGINYYLVKIDAKGNEQWEKTYYEDGQLYSLQQTSDGGYILGGIQNVNLWRNRSPHGVLITKIDTNGNMQWEKLFEDPKVGYLKSIKQTPDGGYIFGTYSNLSRDYSVIKTDSTGTQQWTKTFGGSGDDQFSSLQQTSDGGYILGGYSGSDISGAKTAPNKGDADYWIVKIDSSGNKQWDQTYGGSSGDYLFALQQTSDRGYILGGYSNSGVSSDKTDTSRGGADYWIIKLADTTHYDHPKPTICINDVSITEGNSGQTQLKFTVSLNETSDQVVKVCYGTRNGSATAPEDYVATSGTLTFAPGTRSQTVTVLVNGDKQCEGDETFTVQLSDAVNATIKEGIGTGTILNDDLNCNGDTSITLNINGRAIVIAPNPVSSIANLHLNGFSGITTIQLVSLKGNVLKTFKVQGGSISKQFSVAELPNGAYYLAVSDEHGHKQSVKVIVAH